MEKAQSISSYYKKDRFTRFLLFLSVSLPIFFIATFSYLKLARDLTAQTVETRHAVTQLASLALKERFDRLADIAISLAGRKAIQRAVGQRRWDEAGKLLNETFDAFPLVDHILITDPNGILKAGVPDPGNFKGKDFSERDWYKGASQGGKPYISVLFRRTFEPRHRVIGVAVPIQNDGGKINGILVLHVEAEKLYEWSRGLDVGPLGFVYFVDRNGQAVSHAVEPGQGRIADFSGLAPVQKALGGLNGAEIVRGPKGAEKKLISYRPVPGYAWAVLVDQPTSIAFKERDEYLQILLWIDVFVYLVALLLVFLFIRISEQREKMTAVLRASAERYRILAENINDVIWSCDLNFQLTYISPSVERLLGYTDKEAMTLKSKEFLAPRSHDLAVKISKDEFALEKKSGMDPHRSRTLELQQRRKDGRYIWVEVTASFLRNSKGQVVGLLGSARNINHRKKNEEMIREATERFLSISDSTADAIVSADEHGNVIFWNQSAEKIFGYRREEMIGRPLTLLMPERYRKGHLRGLERFHATGRSSLFGKTLNLHGLRKDGSEFPCELSICSWTTSQGGVCFGAILRDVTERKKNEQSLRLAEERSRLIIEAVKDYAIIMLDETGRIVTWNEGAERIEGYASTEIMGKHFSKFYTEEDRKNGKPEQLLKNAVEKGASEDEGWRVRKDGTLFWASTMITPLKDTEGRLRGFAKITRDMTERKYAQEALLRQTAELARLESEREHMQLFSYMASHDLREPLHKIVAFGDLLKERVGISVDSVAGDYIARMQNAAVRMGRLLDDIFQFAKITRQEEMFKPVDLKTLIESEVLTDLEARLRETKGVVIVERLPIVNGYAAQIRLLFQNLIANALKFHRKDMAPRVMIQGRVDEKGMAEITVSDNGVGFDEKYLDRIFKPFQRLHGRGEFEGSGLGLAICDKIIFNHGGKLTARSTPGQGSVFIIKLPLGGKGTPSRVLEEGARTVPNVK